MSNHLRHLIATTLYPTKSYSLPAVCERYGLDAGTKEEAFSGKTGYVMSRLEKLSNKDVFKVAVQVLDDYPESDKLRSAVELLRKDMLVIAGSQPADELISNALISFDEDGVHAIWKKALNRRRSDPEGAITAAKALLESICKHIIDEAGKSYGESDDLPKLYNSAAECLNLAPSQHVEKVFKSILGNCQSVVSNLAAIRNKLGDSHGQGRRPVKPKARHAELAVNLAGSIAVFLVSTWGDRKV